MRAVSPSASHTLEWMWHDEPGPLHVVLRHERERTTVEPGDLLGRVLVDGVTIGHLERLGVLEVDLVLAEPRLTLRELHRDPRVVDAVADRADEVLVAGGLEHVVVLDVGAVRREAGVPRCRRLLVAVAEQDELQLRPALDRVPGLLGARDLATQDLAGRDLDRVAGGRVEEIAEDERGLLQPRAARAACRGRAGRARRRSPSPSSRTGSREASSCRRRPRGGSCTRRCRGRARGCGRSARSPASPSAGPADRGTRRRRYRSRRRRSDGSAPRRRAAQEWAPRTRPPVGRYSFRG